MNRPPLFDDRRAAGRRLGRRLAQELADAPAAAGGAPRVLGLPRGGVPVAFEVARALGAPLDVFVVRKLGVPWQPELAMGAIAGGGVRVLNRDVVRSGRIDDDAIERVAARERMELERREARYRAGAPPLEIAGRRVVLVDDGLATGATLRAAARALGALGPAELIAAVPVGAPDTCEALRDEVGRLVCLETPEPFLGVGRWYRSFPQTTDDEVRELLARRAEEAGTG